VTEGDDKPAKYPVMFRAADLVLVTKTDLLEVIDDFSVTRAREAVQALTLFALRGLGVVDARARGLVVQAALPADAG
jgi:hypothetical protein